MALLAAATFVTLLVVQGVIAAVSLDNARTQQGSLSRAISTGDVGAASAALRSMQQDTHRARQALSGPQWLLPEALPWVGDDVRALRLTVRTLDDVMLQSVAPMVEAVGALDEGTGSARLQDLARLRPLLDTSADNAQAAADRLDRINLQGLLPPLRGPVGQVRDSVHTLAELTRKARDAATVGASFLGVGGGPSTILFGVQNPAELRGTGGIIGAWAVMVATDGHLRIAASGVNDALSPYEAAASAVPDDVLVTYGKAIRHVANVNMSPDFPLAARLLRSSFTNYAQHVPGAPQLPASTNVLTLTPQGLAALIRVTGPVPLSATGETVTAENAADLFMNRIYTLIPGTNRRNAAVQDTITAVFTALQSPAIDRVAMLRALSTSGAAGQLMMWSPDARTQQAVRSLGLSGELPAADGSSLVVTFVSSDAAKLDYYVQEQTSLDRASGTLTVRLTNHAPRQLAPYVAVQDPAAGEPPTGHGVILQLHLPPAVGVSEAHIGGKVMPFSAGTEGEWHVVRRGLRVAVGAPVTVEFALSGDVGAVQRIETQPMARQPTVDIR